MPDYRCSNCHQPTTPILCSVGVAADCCEEAEVLVMCDPWGNNDAYPRPLTAFEEDELKRELFDDLPRTSRTVIARGDAS